MAIALDTKGPEIRTGVLQGVRSLWVRPVWGLEEYESPGAGERVSAGQHWSGPTCETQASLPTPPLQGPESEVELVKGSQVLVTVDPKFQTRGDAKTVWVDYHNITRVVAVGGRIYIDDGLISLVVRKIGMEMPALGTFSSLWFPRSVCSRPPTPSPCGVCFPTCPSGPCCYHGLRLGI